jgi:hypothetical protein
VIIEDKICDRQAGRKFRLRLCPAANGLHQFPASLSPAVPRIVGISNRELTMRAVCAPDGSAEPQASASRLPRAHSAKGAIAPRRTSRGIVLAFSNRELELLERPLTHRKQTTAPHSNRELSTNQYYGNSHFHRVRLRWTNGLLSSSEFPRGLPRALFAMGLVCPSVFLTETASHSKTAVTYRKQTVAHFLTGARTAYLRTCVCAKMSQETSRIQ